MNNQCIAYVDGSYNEEKEIYGYGIYMIFNGQVIRLFKANNKPEMKKLRNIAGEIQGVIVAIEKAISLKATEITIFYDFEGVEKWLTGEWKIRNSEIKKYFNYIQIAKQEISLKFKKIKSHSGIELHNRADRLARKAVELI